MVVVEPLVSTKPPPRSVFIGDSKSGDIWRLAEWRKVVGGLATSGSLLKIFNATPNAKPVATPEGTSFLRPVPFTCIAISKETAAPATHSHSHNSSSSHSAAASTQVQQKQPQQQNTLSGKQPITASTAAGPGFSASYAFVLAAIDQRGHIFALDLPKNKYWLVARSGVSGNCAAFSSVRRRELIVGLSDCSLHCYNIDSGQLVARLPAYHRSETHAISVHPELPIAITTSRTESILWDTEKWERKRVLTGTAAPAVQQASFSPSGDSVITSFNDGSIIIWDADTFQIRWKISVEKFAADLSTGPSDHSKMLLVPRSTYFAVSLNGEFMVYGGQTSSLYVWNLIEKRLLHEILLPNFSKRIVSQVEFIGATSVVAVMSSAGEMAFIDVSEAKLVGKLKGKHLFRSFALSPDGNIMSVILMDSKFSIRMLRVDSFLSSKSMERDDETSQIPEFDDKPVEENKDDADINIPEPPPSPKKVTLRGCKSATFFELVEAKEDTTLLNRRKLLRFLKHYGQYPDEYRSLIWRFLLKLPENKESYEALLDKGVHPSLKNFRKKFPLKSDRLAKSMERVLSALAHWSPVFEDIDYLPGLVFPFVQLFMNDMFSGFEVVMTVIVNWCQKWWEYYPNPPIECLSCLENIFAYHDQELLAHLIHYKINSQTYGWTLLHTFFTEILTRKEWLKVWDHLLTNPPAFMYYIIIAYLKSFRIALLDIKRPEDFKYFLTRINPVNIESVIITAYKLHDATPDDISPSNFLVPFSPLLVGQYPIYNQYPEFIVNYQSKMKEKIRNDEEEYLRKRKMAEEVNRLTEELERDKQAWENADWKMSEMVDKWWETMMGAEETHTERKARLDTIEKEQRARALRKIGEARSKFLEHQSKTAHMHASALAKAVGSNRREMEVKVDDKAMDEKFNTVEKEWLARREELLEAREEMARLDQERIEKLVLNAKSVGVPQTQNHSQMISRTVQFKDSMNMTNATPARYPSPTVFRQGDEVTGIAKATATLREVIMGQHKESPGRNAPSRSWSPELLEQSRHRRPASELDIKL